MTKQISASRPPLNRFAHGIEHGKVICVATEKSRSAEQADTVIGSVVHDLLCSVSWVRRFRPEWSQGTRLPSRSFTGGNVTDDLCGETIKSMSYSCCHFLGRKS